VSIFSLSPERHDAVTGVPGSLSRAVRGLFRLRRAGISLSVKCPLLAGSAGDHAAVRRLAERLGAGLEFDPHVQPAADGGLGPTRCRGDDGTLVSFLADPATLSADAWRPTTPIPADRAPCGMARSFVTIGSQGDVFPCPLLRRPVGNLRQAPLAALWRSPAMERLRARRFGDLAVCGTCPRSGYCDRCSATALLEDGDLDGPSSRACHVADLRERAWGICAPPGADVPRKPPRAGDPGIGAAGEGPITR
jgi:radical SAM protein with 4Fe4S-binding SPASM domain